MHFETPTLRYSALSILLSTSLSGSFCLGFFVFLFPRVCVQHQSLFAHSSYCADLFFLVSGSFGIAEKLYVLFFRIACLNTLSEKLIC